MHKCINVFTFIVSAIQNELSNYPAGGDATWRGGGAAPGYVGNIGLVGGAELWTAAQSCCVGWRVNMGFSQMAWELSFICLRVCNGWMGTVMELLQRN